MDIFNSVFAPAFFQEHVGISSACDTLGRIPLGLSGTRWAHAAWVWKHSTARCEGRIHDTCVSNAVVS